MTIGQRIRKLRRNKKMSQERLATKVGYKDRSSISIIERGKMKPSLDKIEQIAKALDTDLGYLISGGDIKTFVVTIEETIDQTFEIAAIEEEDALEIAISDYMKGNLVIDCPCVTDRKISINGSQFARF